MKVFASENNCMSVLGNWVSDVASWGKECDRLWIWVIPSAVNLDTLTFGLVLERKMVKRMLPMGSLDFTILGSCDLVTWDSARWSVIDKRDTGCGLKFWVLPEHTRAWGLEAFSPANQQYFTDCIGSQHSLQCGCSFEQAALGIIACLARVILVIVGFSAGVPIYSLLVFTDWVQEMHLLHWPCCNSQLQAAALGSNISIQYGQHWGAPLLQLPSKGNVGVSRAGGNGDWTPGEERTALGGTELPLTCLWLWGGEKVDSGASTARLQPLGDWVMWAVGARATVAWLLACSPSYHTWVRTQTRPGIGVS